MIDMLVNIIYLRNLGHKYMINCFILTCKCGR